MSTSLQVVGGTQQAAVLLNPIRLQLLERLSEPKSATALSKELQIGRQKINYHLNELEKSGLVEFVEERKRGNCLERIVRATARMYLIHPEAVGRLAADPAQIADQFSASYMIALSARTIRELTVLEKRAKTAGKQLATFNLQADVRFASAADRSAFAEELTECVARLIGKYHNQQAESGRTYRFVLGGYPAITKQEDENDRQTEVDRKDH